jgi:hypothetical protein
MKRTIQIIAVCFTVLLSSCIKNDAVIFDGAQVEFDAATWNAKAAGLTYPVLSRVPAVGTNTTTAQPAITRSTGSFTVRVNLIGAQQNTDTEFSYRVVAAESTAVEGTHYSAFSGTGTIPANSSFGTITVNVLNPGPGAGSVVLVLELLDNANFESSTNYAKIGLSISQS